MLFQKMCFPLTGEGNIRNHRASFDSPQDEADEEVLHVQQHSHSHFCL